MPKALTREEILERVQAVDDRLSIDFDTFQGYSKKCRFVDSELGKFWTKPVWLVSQKSGHPARSREKQKKTVEVKYGATHFMQSPRGRAIAREKWHSGVAEKAAEGRDRAGFRGFADPEILKKATDTMRQRYGSEREAKKPKSRVDNKKYLLGKDSLWSVAKESGIPCSTLQQRCQQGLSPEEALRSWKSGVSRLKVFCAERFDWYRCDKKVLSKSYRPDFRLSENLFIDVDGLFRHSEKRRNRSYHYKKREDYESEGKQILQFYASEIRKKPEVVRSIVNAKTGALARKIYARNCQISEVRDSSFFEKNHLMGERRGARHFFLQFKGENVFGISVSRSKDELEIQRCASALDTQVVGGLSRLLKYILKNYIGVSRVVSWVDLRYSDGKGFEKCGFYPVREHVSFKWTDGYETFNRRTVRAQDGRTESDIAKELSLLKIFDAGQRLLVKYV